MDESSTESAIVRRLGQVTFAINRTFADLRPLLFRTRILALNAEIVSARIGRGGDSFGVVVRDLIQMGGELTGIVAATEALFQKAAGHVAWWLRMRQQFDLYLRALASHRVATRRNESDAPSSALGDGEPFASLSILDRVALTAAAENACAQADGDASLRILWERAIAARDKAVSRVLEIKAIVMTLDRLLTRMAFVATRQSHFLATSSMIEACRAGEAAALLRPVAENIRRLADSFMALQSTANLRTQELAAMANAVARLAGGRRKGTR